MNLVVGLVAQTCFMIAGYVDDPKYWIPALLVGAICMGHLVTLANHAGQ